MKPVLLFGSGLLLGSLATVLVSGSMGAEIRTADAARVPGNAMPRDLEAASRSPSPLDAPLHGELSTRVEISPSSEAAAPQSPSLEPVLLRDAFTALAEALHNHPEWTGEEAPYLEKYAGLSNEERLIANFALQNRLGSERARIGRELISRGDYETHVLSGDSPVSVMKTGLGEPTRSFGFSTEVTEAGAVMKLAPIDPARYPEFHALQMESWWLGMQLRREGILDPE
jgi:hypothetical protein